MTRARKRKLEKEAAHGQVSPLNIVTGKRLRRMTPRMGREGFDQVLDLKKRRGARARALARKYGNLRYKKIPGSSGRYVDFSPYTLKHKGALLETRIPYQGTRPKDYAEAERRLRISTQIRKQLGGTWHHAPDVDSGGSGTLMLVPSDLHGISHKGGVEQYKELARHKNRLPNFY